MFKYICQSAFVFLLIVNSVHAQILTINELVNFPFMGADKTGEQLNLKGWHNSNVEFVTDSNLLRKTWSVENKYNDLKSYVQFLEFNQREQDNYISYQFSDRKTFENYFAELKKMGYKDFAPSKKKKKKKGEPNIYKEVDKSFINEKTNSLILLREVFLYGMNAFVVYAFKAESKSAQYFILREKDK